MQKKTYCAPEMHTIAMLTEGIIAGSDKICSDKIKISDDPTKYATEEQTRNSMSRGLDEPSSSLWD